MKIVDTKSRNSVKTQLMMLSTAELEQHIELYRDLKSKSVNDEIWLELLDQEMERRILAWEAAEV